MEKYAKILEDIKRHQASEKTAATDHLCDIHYDLREVLRRYHAGEATEAEREAARAAELKARAAAKREQDRNEAHKLAAEILKDNAAQAFYAENIGKICEIWNSYAGKPHGEKTADKIRADLKAATGYYMSIGNRYSRASIYICTERDPVENIEIGTAGASELRAIDENNKILKLDPAALRVYYCGDYVNDINAHIKELRKAHDNARRAYEKAQEAISAYNTLTRGNIRHENIHEGVKKWII